MGSKWISVEDKMPMVKQEYQEFLVCYDGIVALAWPYRDNGEWFWGSDDAPPHVKVTHWMPLPEPPSEQKD